MALNVVTTNLFRYLVIAAAIVLGSSCLAAQSTNPKYRTDLVLIGNSSRLGKIKLKFEFYDIKRATRDQKVRVWGTGLPLDVAIKSVDFSIDGRQVRVPHEAYANLRNICLQCFTVYEKNHRVYLSIVGGDGDNHYESTLEVVNGFIKSRVTVGGSYLHQHAPFERIVFGENGSISYSLIQAVPASMSKNRGVKIPLTPET